MKEYTLYERIMEERERRKGRKGGRREGGKERKEAFNGGSIKQQQQQQHQHTHKYIQII